MSSRLLDIELSTGGNQTQNCICCGTVTYVTVPPSLGITLCPQAFLTYPTSWGDPGLLDDERRSLSVKNIFGFQTLESSAVTRINGATYG